MSLVRVNGSWINPHHVEEIRAVQPVSRRRTEVFFVSGRTRELDAPLHEVVAALSGTVVHTTDPEAPA